jgi:putative SOS response-associated peptidase YedK
MPVILKPEVYDDWLDEKMKDERKMEELLIPYPAGEMTSHAVSKSVNIPDSDSDELIRPLNSL